MSTITTIGWLRARGGRIVRWAATSFWSGDAIGHADIALACALRFLRDAHPALFDGSRHPALAGHAARCEALPAFQAVQQSFIPPA